MLKEVLLLVLVGWMIMPAHPWKPPEHGYRNDDTSDKLDRPSPQNTQKNIRDRRNYILHGYGYSNPTGPEIFRQLRHTPGGKSAWETCNEWAKNSTKDENSKMTPTSKNRPKPSPKFTKRHPRAFLNYTLHGQSYWDPTDIKSFDQFKLRFNKKYKNEKEEADRKYDFQKNLQDITYHNVQYKLRKKSYMKQVSYYSDWTKDIKSFDQFKLRFNKKYENEKEEADRKYDFQKNLKDITYHNVQYKLRKKSYMKQVSYDSDMNKGEFINKDVGCIKAPREKRSMVAKQYMPKMEGNESESIDYRKCGAINPVRHQGECGSCWAFSVVSSIESQIFLKYRKKLHLSEQEMVDCSPGNCDGGWPNDVIQYYMGKELALGNTYPYIAENKERVNGGCKYDAPKAGYKVSAMIQPDNDAHLLNALVHKGPISVVIYTSWNFNHYREGVLDDELCTKDRAVDHAVTLIGYGTENGKKYWLLRNSHGEDMGEGGYFKLARDKVNHCNISDYAYIPEIQ